MMHLFKGDQLQAVSPSVTYIQEGGYWAVDGGSNVQDPEGVMYVVDKSTPPTIGVIAFKLLFTATERIAVKTSTDPVVQDFWQLVEDPRTTEVNLALKSVQDALRYLEAEGLLSTGRADQIITGVAA